MEWVFRSWFVFGLSVGHEAWEGLGGKEEDPSDDGKVQVESEEGNESVKIPVGHCGKLPRWCGSGGLRGAWAEVKSLMVEEKEAMGQRILVIRQSQGAI